MAQLNSYNLHQNSVFNNKLESNIQNKKDRKLNLKEFHNTYSFPIFSDDCNCNRINKQPFNNDEKINANKKDFGLKEGIENNNNSENNCSSTFEIIEYPVSEKSKHINVVIESEQYNFDKYLKNYKIPLDIKGDSDDDIYLNEKELNLNKKEKFKSPFQNTNYHNWSKTSSGVNSDLLLDYDKQKKILVILNNTRKYHEELKSKINNFKKLIYSTKDKNNGKILDSSYKKIKEDKNLKFNTNIKEKKKEKVPNFYYSNNKRDKEYISINKKIIFDNSTVKESSISDIDANQNYFNLVNYLNNSTIESNKISNKKCYPMASFKTNIQGKNNIKKEIYIKKILIKKDNIISSTSTNKDIKCNRKINTIKNINHLFSKTNIRYSKENLLTNKKIINNKEQINKDKNDKSIKEFNSVRDNNSIKKEKKNETMKLKNENKITNQKSNVNHIFENINQIENKKIEKIKSGKINNNKIENHNPFKDEANYKKDNKSHLKEIIIKKDSNTQTNKMQIKDNKKNITHTPTKKFINFYLNSIK